VLLISALVISLTIGIQCYLIRCIYESEETRFNVTVTKSLGSLFESELLRRRTGQFKEFVEQPNSDVFLVRYDSASTPDSLLNNLLKEFTDYNLYCSFRLGFSEKGSDRFMRLYNVNADASQFEITEVRQAEATLLPPVAQQLYLHFSAKQEFLYHRLLPWILSGLFLILSLTTLAVILYYYYKHRFWNGIQKQFVNNFIHEFRTPLSVISIAGKVLQADGIEKHPSRLKKYARIIKDQTDQLQSKVDQILELALSGRKSSRMQKRIVDVNSLIANAINLVEPMVKEKRASIEFVQSGDPLRLQADGSYLTQAIVNLLDNSLKYAKLPQIRLETAISEKDCAISIKDNGIGMEEKYFKHIFRKYYRIPTGNVHNVKGFGIGLNFVKNVIDAHNGQIEVSSVTGKGTEFRIKLPLT
jgi:two-component system phosphate regulon sensor histidine kinase PhoR